MGHHYVPQRYLRGFQTRANTDEIWMYCKATGTRKLVPIKGVAQAAAFYADDVEEAMNTDVEIPGNDVIDKIRTGRTIDEIDRMQLTYYIATMMRRTPYARQRSYEHVPKAVADTVEAAKKSFGREHEAGRIGSAELAKRLVELEAAEAKFSNQPPEEIVNVIETPWPFQSMLIAISSMYWRIRKTNGPSFFLTSDNPATFFEAFGLGNPECELIFPLCTDLLLHCSWKRWRDTAPQLGHQKEVKEFNRRTAFGAERFIFYPNEVD